MVNERYDYMGNDDTTYIFDSETSDFLTVKEIVERLNTYERNMGVVLEFMGDIHRKIIEDGGGLTGND